MSREYFDRSGYEKIERYSAYDNGANWYFTPVDEAPRE